MPCSAGVIQDSGHQTIPTSTYKTRVPWVPPSRGSALGVTLQLVEFDALPLLKEFPALFAGEAVLDLGAMLLHVPVQRRPLPALEAANLTL